MKTPKQAAYLFFLKHGACSYNPSKETKRQGYARQARQLAKAERDARALGYIFAWEIDRDGCIGCTCGNKDCACSTNKPHETLQCEMWNLGDDSHEPHIVQSLGGICEPSHEYRRVVEAELASEQLG
jgi:hypothetical protein